MSSFGRSFKPSYLSSLGGRRPPMPGRTLSNSSETSLAAGSGPRDDRPCFSSSNTPSSESGHIHLESSAAAQAVGGSAESQQPQQESSSRFSGSTGPINIELPQIRKFSSAPVYTPPAPLSARGDLPGGYFPLHEDPDNRIQTLHPFHSDNEKLRQQSSVTSATVDTTTTTTTTTTAAATATITTASATATTASSHHHRHSSQRPTAQIAMNVTRPELSTPVVASYLPTGAHDTVVPMGKYYPSNYENRNRHLMRHGSSTSTVSSVKSNQHTAKTEGDVKSRLQQYQRDMVAQTRMVANDVIASSTPSTPNSSTRNPFPFGSTVIIGTSMMSSTPISPRLHPLGSPGPVTPMNLEDSDGDYLSKGRATPGIDAAGSGMIGQERGKR